MSLKRFLTTLHSLNVGMDCYNVIFHSNNAEIRGNQVTQILRHLDKMSLTQMGFFESVHPKAITRKLH